MIARRRGKDWFVGGMTADHAFRLSLPLTFLGEGRYAAHVFADPADRTTPYESLEVTRHVATSADRIQLDMRPAGGAAIRFERILHSTNRDLRRRCGYMNHMQARMMPALRTRRSVNF